uniref:Uncharacterized protein n=1 Tax=Rhizophora mucronata TaxID=61149 RepID=A0A2P2N2T0_RHIMU
MTFRFVESKKYVHIKIMDPKMNCVSMVKGYRN